MRLDWLLGFVARSDQSRHFLRIFYSCRCFRGIFAIFFFFFFFFFLMFGLVHFFVVNVYL
jgi:hypothetical protein